MENLLSDSGFVEAEQSNTESEVPNIGIPCKIVFGIVSSTIHYTIQ